MIVQKNTKQSEQFLIYVHISSREVRVPVQEYFSAKAASTRSHASCKAAIFGSKGDYANCAVCNQHLKMTQAHVPPRSIIPEQKRNRRAYYYFMGEKYHTLQSGVYFFSLCEKHNKLLGKYDNHLKKFSDDVRRYYELLPHSFNFTVECYLNKVARSVVGSLLTTTFKNIDSSWGDLQNYITDESAIFPQGISLGFWLHPHESVSVIPQMCIVSKPRKRTSLSSPGAPPVNTNPGRRE